MRRRRWGLLGLAFVALAAAGCLRLPETQEESPSPVETDDPAELRTLMSVTDLGVCDETGWSGVVVSNAASGVDLTVVVTFLGLGSDEVAVGSARVEVPAAGRAAFTVTPQPATEELVLTCSLELTELSAR